MASLTFSDHPLLIVLALSSVHSYFRFDQLLFIKRNLILLSVVLSNFAFAQSVSTLMGARAMGVGFASAAISDAWGIFNNPAGLAKTTDFTFASSYHHHPYLKSFNRSAFVAALPAAIGTFGVGVFRFGDALYNEQLLCGAFSNELGIASLGGKVNFVQYTAEGFGSRRMLTASLGGIVNFTPTFLVGAHITNINQPKIGENTNERVPTTVNLGVSLKPSKSVYLTAEVEKKLTRPTTIKAGLEYNFNQKFYFRTAVSRIPDAAFGGFGFHPRRLRLDYGVQYLIATNLISHQASLGIQLTKK